MYVLPLASHVRVKCINSDCGGSLDAGAIYHVVAVDSLGHVALLETLPKDYSGEPLEPAHCQWRMERFELV